MLLTHSHIDHIGALPRFVKDGFHGPVYCTAATKELARLMLLDSAKIQQEDARYANRKGYSKHKPALPLYDEADAKKALKLLRKVDYESWIDLGEKTRARYLAGRTHPRILEYRGSRRADSLPGSVDRVQRRHRTLRHAVARRPGALPSVRCVDLRVDLRSRPSHRTPFQSRNSSARPSCAPIAAAEPS